MTGPLRTITTDIPARMDRLPWSAWHWRVLLGAGTDMLALATAVIAGQRRTPPADRGVPGWLRGTIERGLAVDPARRWSSMHVLIAVLERGQTHARRWAVVLVCAGLATIAACVVGAQRWDVARRVAVCEAAGGPLGQPVGHPSPPA